MNLATNKGASIPRSRLLALRGHRNEDGSALPELIISMAMFGILVAMIVMPQGVGMNAFRESDVRTNVGVNSGFVNAYRDAHTYEGTANYEAPRTLSFVSEACDEPTVMMEGIPLSVSPNVCLIVTGTTDEYVMTAQFNGKKTVGNLWTYDSATLDTTMTKS